MPYDVGDSGGFPMATTTLSPRLALDDEVVVERIAMSYDEYVD